jgi:hypothetical protein
VFSRCCRPKNETSRRNLIGFHSQQLANRNFSSAAFVAQGLRRNRNLRPVDSAIFLATGSRRYRFSCLATGFGPGLPHFFAVFIDRANRKGPAIAGFFDWLTTPQKNGRDGANFHGFLTNHQASPPNIGGIRSCTTCQHIKRSEIDCRLAAGEPAAQVARDYELSASSLQRHRANCLKLTSSNAIKKEAARGTAAVALLPSKENLSSDYAALQVRIDEIVTQAQQQGTLHVAISGLNSIRQTLDSLARLAGHLQPAGTQVNVAVQTNVNVGAEQFAERLIQKFDHQPELKAQIAGNEEAWWENLRINALEISGSKV